MKLISIIKGIFRSKPKTVPKIVMDTSVLVAAMFNQRAHRIIDLWKDERFILCCSPDIFCEYERILGKIPVIRENGLALLQEIRRSSSLQWITQPPQVHTKIDDPDDVKFVACAVAAGADYIVSLDDHLLSLNGCPHITVARPGEFLSLPIFQDELNTGGHTDG
jgi:uncharacterized protein